MICHRSKIAIASKLADSSSGIHAHLSIRINRQRSSRLSAPLPRSLPLDAIQASFEEIGFSLQISYRILHRPVGPSTAEARAAASSRVFGCATASASTRPRPFTERARSVHEWHFPLLYQVRSFISRSRRPSPGGTRARNPRPQLPSPSGRIGMPLRPFGADDDFHPHSLV